MERIGIALGAVFDLRVRAAGVDPA